MSEKKEIFKITPEYHFLATQEKIEILKFIKQWANEQLSELENDGQREDS